MGQRLFVDVDDTLVKYQSRQAVNPYGLYKGDPWEPNQRLIDGMRAFREANPDTLIVVWSGGGREYAMTWIDLLKLNPSLDVAGMGKDLGSMAIVRPDDIVVDDMADSLKVSAVKVYGPDEWPEQESRALLDAAAGEETKR